MASFHSTSTTSSFIYPNAKTPFPINATTRVTLKLSEPSMEETSDEYGGNKS